MSNPSFAYSRNVSRMFSILGDQKTPPVHNVQQAHTQELSLEFYMINRGNVFLVSEAYLLKDGTDHHLK